MKKPSISVDQLLNHHLVTMQRLKPDFYVTVQKPALAWRWGPADRFGPLPYAEANKLYRIEKLKGALCALDIYDIEPEDLERKYSRMVDAVRTLVGSAS
jgi:hypothetical protein